ncbi:ATP-binding protein [Kineosporia babensis]|uniref:Uncharacterized protein n=1 Tax=Kineosporia babensis TaxID=499548 RepID=A0A9X1NG70_9ACTN|nr:hypothetical protein [Kineosporia babensis]MCD5313445.1 hypothetical protein [Kineosporia babensis]
MRASGALAAGRRALHQEGDLARSRREHAAALAEVADPQTLAETALGLGGMWVHEHRTLTESLAVRALQRQALWVIPPDDPRALRLRIRLAAEADYADAGTARVLRALREAERAGDPVALAEALSLAHHCLLGPGEDQYRRGLALRLIEVASFTGRHCDLVSGLLWHCVDLFLAADPNAERGLAELRALLERREHLAARFVLRALETMLLIRAGRFDEAEPAAELCAKEGIRAGDADAEGWYVLQMLTIRWYQGRAAELAPLIRRAAHSPSLSTFDQAHFAALALVSAPNDQALGRLGAPEDLPSNSSRLLVLHAMIHAGIAAGEHDLVARAAAELKPFARLPVMASLGVSCFGSASEALGAAAVFAGEIDRAIECFSTAVADNLAIGHRPAADSSRLALAAALEARGRTKDVATALRYRQQAGHGGPVAVKCTRQQQGWRLEFGAEALEVEDLVGMAHLAVLLANPGRAVPVAELVGTGEESAQPVLDPQARQEYRRRLEQLAAQAERWQEEAPERAARARQEREWLIAELAAATGRGGRSREFAGSAERARTAVAKAIRRALERIEVQHAELGRRLRAEIRTGMSCCYEPGSR